MASLEYKIDCKMFPRKLRWTISFHKTSCLIIRGNSNLIYLINEVYGREKEYIQLELDSLICN